MYLWCRKILIVMPASQPAKIVLPPHRLSPPGQWRGFQPHRRPRPHQYPHLILLLLPVIVKGWWFAGAIPPFNMPSANYEPGRLGLSPQGATSCFSYWSSPQLQVLKDKVYRTRWHIESSANHPDATIDFRLRCNQLSNWRFWDTGVYSYNLSAPSVGTPQFYDCIIFPQMQTPNDIIQLSFDILGFDPLNDLNSWIYFNEVAIDEVTITP